MQMFILLLLSLLFSSCSECRRHDYATLTICDFIAESGTIAQEKGAVNALENPDANFIPCELLEEIEDTICDGDILNIAVFHPCRPDLIEDVRFFNNHYGFPVTDGVIRLPGMPEIEVGCLTLRDAKEKIEQVYAEEINNVTVYVSFRFSRDRHVDITGSAAAVMVPITGKTRLYEVLGQAFLAPYANLNMSYVMRGDEKLPVNLYKLLNQGDMSQNIVMCGGDKIFVAEGTEAKIMVLGETWRPHVFPLPYGFMSIREAIVLARGIPFTADKSCIQVIRSRHHTPRIFVMSWKDIIKFPNEDLLLVDGDIVYLSERPITQWNRFISQLYPSLVAWEFATQVNQIWWWSPWSYQ